MRSLDKNISWMFLFVLGAQCEICADQQVPFDLVVAGFVNFADGIGRQTVGFIDCVKDVLKVKFVNTRPEAPLFLDDVPLAVRPILLTASSGQSNVALLEDVLTNGNPIQALRQDYYKRLPESRIKLAYTMFESNNIPHDWHAILNNNFDGAIVPDEYLVESYQSAGVRIPIFVLPLGMYMHDFLAEPLKQRAHKPFVFGFTGSFSPRKNHAVLLESFAQAFGNNPDVCLKLHGRSGSAIAQNLKKRIDELQLTNVELIEKSFTWGQYVDFMKNLDCYATLSKGEGFSITPREALALGIPCIVSNNTAHQTICKTGLVKAVSCPIVQPAYYPHLEEVVGVEFNCTIDEAAQALVEVYQQYDAYLAKAGQAREWVGQYLYENLRPKYCSLIKPQKIILGYENAIYNDRLVTDSIALFQKYESIGEGNIK